MNNEKKTYNLNEYIQLLSDNYLLVDNHSAVNNAAYIEHLTYNSNDVISNTLFICKGAAFKEEYLLDSINKGAVAYVSEKKYEVAKDIPCIIVSDIRKSMPLLADLFYNSPWKDLQIIGIGGTKGKSTTAYYIKHIIDEYMTSIGAPKCAIISSIDTYDGVISKESHITTPESVELMQHFDNARTSGIKYVVMEVSSQALKYNRVDNMRFDVGAFLNISEDHISPIEHPDFDDYFNSKLSMFSKTDHLIINRDTDCYEMIMNKSLDAKSYSTISKIHTDANYYGHDIRKKEVGIEFEVKSDTFNSTFSICMPGMFNVSNALVAIACAEALQIPLSYIKSGLAKATSSGRMELFKSSDDKIIAIVDYAHNKLSFDALFSSMKTEFPDYDIVSLFGCPGKKALKRREDLGLIAGEYSSKVYIVAEDPGYEPVEDISNDIAQYVKIAGCPYEIIEDRGVAIQSAIKNVKNKTLLLITGKGRETRQKYGGEYIDCPSDVAYVMEYLNNYNQRVLELS
ncbi:MAG: Mur ligase family protein [Suipraeoptans sp.]